MLAEAEILMHASKGLNRALKVCLTLSIVFIISIIEYGCVNAVINGLEAVKYWFSMLFDSSSLTFPLICMGVYTRLPFQTAQILGSLPFLLMIFLSTTFSPGSGVPVIKELRYLFARFYFWCQVPSVENQMEGCPKNLTMLYLVLSALVGLFVFLCVQLLLKLRKKSKNITKNKERASMMDTEFQELQVELYGEKALRRLKHMSSSVTQKENPEEAMDVSEDV